MTDVSVHNGSSNVVDTRGCTMDWEIICLLLLSGLSSQVKLYISSQVIESLIKCPTQYGKEDPRTGDLDGRPLLSSGPIWADDDDDDEWIIPLSERKPNVNVKTRCEGCQILTCNHISCRQCLRKTSTQKHPRSLPVVFCKTCKRSVAAIDEERKRYDCNICGKKQTVLCENCAMFFCNRCVLTCMSIQEPETIFFLSFTTKSGNSANKVADTGVIPKECQIKAYGSLGATFGSLGNKPGQFKTPTGVASNSEAHIIVSDSGNNRIQIFNAYGDFIHEFDGCGSDADKFNKQAIVMLRERE
ncbi:E3 ubiquitin-protein ligase TRIM71 [Nymphon striatum]|nr:E3 ubiquitin-protein ligase TRIM71 [Nymphon striatum]